MNSNKTKLGFLYAIILLWSIGCSNDSDPAPDPITRMLARIEIESSQGTTLDVGQTTTLSVNGFDQQGQPFSFSSPITWTSSSPDIMVSSIGIVTGIAGSSSTITATTQELQASLTIRYNEEAVQVGYEIFVSDANNFGQGPWQILRFDGTGGNPRLFTNQNLAWPQDIVILEAEKEVLISNLNSGRITKYDLDSGAYLGDFALVAGGPTRMKFGPDGLLYVLQWQGNGNVLRFNRNGTFVDTFTSVGVNQSIGMDWDQNDNLYVSSFGDAHIRKYDSNGQDMGLFITSSLSGPTNIYVMANGNLLVNDWTAGVVQRFSESGQFLNSFITGVGQVEGLGKTPDGNLLLGHGTDSSIKEYSASGSFIQEIITSGAGGLSQPNAVVVRELN